MKYAYLGFIALLSPLSAHAFDFDFSSLLGLGNQSANNVDSLNRFSKSHENSYEYWGLTKEEWARYESLKKNSPWSVWENHGSPLAVLFYYANSKEEKRHYARLEAELDQWRQNAVVEFESYYDREREVVFAQFQAGLANKLPTLDNLTPSDHVRVFMENGVCDIHCKTIMNRLYNSQAKVDVFVLHAKSNDDIFAWASSAGVPVERVKVKQITLNHENGLLKLIATSANISNPKVPCVFKTIDAGTSQWIEM